MEDLTAIAFIAFALAYLLLLSFCARELLYALLLIASVVIVIDGCGLHEKKISPSRHHQTTEPFEYE